LLVSLILSFAEKKAEPLLLPPPANAATADTTGGQRPIELKVTLYDDEDAKNNNNTNNDCEHNNG
jgi:hypothetical protein